MVTCRKFGKVLRGGSRTAATCKMERFMIIVNGFQPLTIITKPSILDVAAVLDPPLLFVRVLNKHALLKKKPLKANLGRTYLKCYDQMLSSAMTKCYQVLQPNINQMLRAKGISEHILP